MKNFNRLSDSELSEIAARVLVIDDNENVRNSYSEVLSIKRQTLDKEIYQLVENLLEYEDEEHFDHYPFKSMHIDYAHVSSDALDKVNTAFEEEKPYHVIFLDIQMPPEEDGLFTTKNIWEKYPDQQIILCTAYSKYTFSDINKVLSERRQNLLMLRKPFDPESVRLIVQSQIINAELHWRQANVSYG